jgi:hypothetical protein
MIVAMKICFRIGAEQDGSQQPKPYRSVRKSAALASQAIQRGARLLAAQPVSRQKLPRQKIRSKLNGFFEVVTLLLTGTGLKTQVVENRRLNPV